MKEEWGNEKLKYLSKIMYGYTSKSSTEFDGPKYLRITDIQNQTVNWNKVPNCKISEEEFKKYKLLRGDIVFARTGATTGKSYLMQESPISVFASYLIRVQPKNDILLPEFLYMYFSSEKYWQNIGIGISGSAQGGFNATKLGNLDIPIPSLSEQKRIVQILNQVFEKIDSAIANIEQNIKNAEELFQAKGSEVFSQNGIGWEEKKIADIGKVSMCKRILKKQTTTEGGVPFYKIGTFGKEPNAFIPEDIYQEFISKYSFPKKGDILISASGTIGRRVVYDGEPAYFQDSNIVWIDNNEKTVLNEYLYEFYGFCDWNPSKGATISRLYNDDLRRIKISYPPIDQQKNIVRTIKELKKKTKCIADQYRIKQKNLEELKKSLLEKAFKGEMIKNVVEV